MGEYPPQATGQGGVEVWVPPQPGAGQSRWAAQAMARSDALVPMRAFIFRLTRTRTTRKGLGQHAH